MWIAEGQANPPASALQYFDAIPSSWTLSAQSAYPAPIVSAKEGREIALSFYKTRDF
jgi:deoxyribodipyrimidine photo-lyase